MIEKKKPGRKPLPKAKKLYQRSVNLTRELQIKFLRLGGSRWLREQIANAKDRDEKVE